MYLFCFKEITVQWMIAAHRLVLLVMDHFLWTYDDLNTKALFKKNLQDFPSSWEEMFIDRQS